MYEYVKGRVPHTDHLSRIYVNHGVSLDWLVTGSGEPSVKPCDAPSSSDQVGGELAELLGKTAEVLRSGTDYADSLSANIKSFHKSVEMERRLSQSQGRDATEDRLEKLERMCEEIKDRLEHRADPQPVPRDRPAKAAGGG